MKKSILKRQSDISPLLQQKRIQAQGGKGNKRGLMFAINMTTLIDAFCILVIFLLSNMNGQLQNLQISKDIVLPFAKQSDVVEEGLVVRLEKNGFSVDEQKIENADLLTKALVEAKQKLSGKNSIIIQADKESDFSAVSSILRAAGIAGFDKYMFAVLPGR